MMISVLTPTGEVFEGEISAVNVPGVNGAFEVRRNHAPIVSALQTGRVRLTKMNGEQMNFDIEKGFIEVLQNQVALLVTGIQQV